MQFDIEAFVNNLQKRALSKQETAKIIYEEIRDAENQKVRFLDQASLNPSFYKALGSQVDSYITYLKVLHNKINPQGQEEIDEKIYRTDKAIIDKTLKLVKELEQVEQHRMGANFKASQNSTSTDFNNT